MYTYNVNGKQTTGRFSAVGLANRRDRGKTIREEKIYFRRVCWHAIGTTDEGLLLAAADNNTYFHIAATACTRVQVDDKRRTNNGDDVPILYI